MGLGLLVFCWVFCPRAQYEMYEIQNVLSGCVIYYAGTSIVHQVRFLLDNTVVMYRHSDILTSFFKGLP
jgi:hypothetical protein